MVFFGHRASYAGGNTRSVWPFFFLTFPFIWTTIVCGRLLRLIRPLSLYLCLRATHPIHTLSLRHPPNHSTAFAGFVGLKAGNIF